MAEYERRMVDYLGFSLIEIPLAKRTKSSNIRSCREKEAEDLLARLQQDDYVVALDVAGKIVDTAYLAKRLQEFRDKNQALSLLVGGPDGLSDSCLARANERWSLSALTLPHPLVRILVAEQLYRASSILRGHPYHRE